MCQKLNGIELHELLSSGYRNLKKNMNTVNDLNVFPVPDGDTGTNMVHTFGGGLKASPSDMENVGEYMSALSRAALLSARGNSGVIFSQFINGLYRGFSDKQEIKFSDFAKAFKCAKEDAYKSIITPTEGTILTVIRFAAEFLEENAEKFSDFKSGFEALTSKMKVTLSQTPELLPVLKEAGVVDSGGAGLVCCFEGMYAHLCGESIEDTPELDGSSSSVALTGDFGPDSVLEYGYCTEFILQLMNYKTDVSAFSKDEFVKPLEQLGDSIVAVQNDGIVKIHIHTFTPEKVLEYARRFGEFVTIKIENMSVQHSETQAEVKKEHLKYAIVSVASGKGIIDYFYGIGANVVIDGGQTNNPSVDMFLEAFRSLDAEHIIVLPNNSNIILTANQAAEMFTDSNVRVIPTKSVVEGYSALSMMNLWCDTVEELVDDMSSGLSSVTTALITTATRDVNMNSVAVEKGKYIGLSGKEILVCNEDRIAAATELIRKITSEVEKEVIIVFYGADVDSEEAESFKALLEDEYPLADIGFIEGKQEVYDFIISLE